MRNTSGISKTEQVARWSLDNKLYVTAQLIADHFGWTLAESQRRLQDIQISARYSWVKQYAMVKKGPRMYKVVCVCVLSVKRDCKAAIPLIGVSRDAKGQVISIKRFRSAYQAAEEGFDQSSVIEACKGLRRDHMHAGFAWRYACDDKHALATIQHAAKYKFLSGSFYGVNLKGVQIDKEQTGVSV